MSLKSFHVFFIVISIIFTLGFGVWGLRSGQSNHQWLGVGSLAATIGLIVYLINFIKKAKKLR